MKNPSSFKTCAKKRTLATMAAKLMVFDFDNGDKLIHPFTALQMDTELHGNKPMLAGAMAKSKSKSKSKRGAEDGGAAAPNDNKKPRNDRWTILGKRR